MYTFLERAIARIATERPGALWVVPIDPLAANTRQILDVAAELLAADDLSNEIFC